MTKHLAVASAVLAFATVSPNVAGAEKTGTPPNARVDIQLSLCSPPEQVESALHLQRRGAPLEVWLFDDPALSLFERGLRFRLRLTKGQAELTVKVANQDCAKLALGLVPSGEGKCEYDIHGTTMAGAVSLSRSLDASATRDLLGGQLPLAEALSATQIHYLRSMVGVWPLPAGVRALGPQQVASYGAKGKPYGVDVSQMPTGAPYVEISRKVPAVDATRLYEALVSELTLAGVTICTDQSSQAGNKLRSLKR
ncbi:MAG: hypothetical protein ABI724_15855 [Betaproteobacteria bacterium]